MNRAETMNDVGMDYLEWYFDARVWQKLSYRGVRTLKYPLDMWNYQELIFENDIHWVLETGTRHGGSALYFADLLASGEREGKVVSIDVTHYAIHESVPAHPRIQLLLGDSAAPEMVESIKQLIPDSRRHGMLLILDSDHAAAHVSRELNALVPLLRHGDYLIVEDTVVNGHPVRPDFGPGPYEAIEAYVAEYPERLTADTERESKFGSTFAYRGYYKAGKP
jgi:cephalosporin hydroxylase